MPIKDASLYPPDWPARSLAVRQDAGWLCEGCGARNGAPHPVTGATVVLTVHHVIPVEQGGSHDRANLRSYCQRCHNAADAPMRQRHAAMTRGAKQRERQADAGQEELTW